MKKLLILTLAVAIGYVTGAITLLTWAGMQTYEERRAD